MPPPKTPKINPTIKLIFILIALNPNIKAIGSIDNPDSIFEKTQAEDAVFIPGTYTFASTSKFGGYGSYSIDPTHSFHTQESYLPDSAAIRTSVTNIEGTSIFVHCRTNNLLFYEASSSTEMKNYDVGAGIVVLGVRDMGNGNTPSLLCSIDDSDKISLWDSTLATGSSATLQAITAGSALTTIDKLNHNDKIAVSAGPIIYIYEILTGNTTPFNSITLPGAIVGLSNC